MLVKKSDVEPPVVPRWKRLPRRIGNSSDNTKFASPQQFFTRYHLQVLDFIVNKIGEI